MPKQSLVSAQFRLANGNADGRAGALDQKRSLEQYYKSINCVICGAKMDKQGGSRWRRRRCWVRC